MNWIRKAQQWIRRRRSVATATTPPDDGGGKLGMRGGGADTERGTPGAEDYTAVQTGYGASGADTQQEGEAAQPQALYLRVLTAKDGETPRAGLHPEPNGQPEDGWASGEPLTSAADAATALEHAGGDRARAERALLAIAMTRRALQRPTERILVPKRLRVWKADLSDAVSGDFDYIFGEDEASMRQAAGDAARRGACSNARTAGSLPLTDSDAIERVQRLG